MTDLYLIAHKVRGEPAFDVASRMSCPICHGQCENTPEWPCVECDSTGYWWIIPTSGHRAYPYSVMGLFNGIPTELWREEIGEMPPNLPDHYPHSAEPNKPKIDLSTLLAKSPPKPIRRRV